LEVVADDADSSHWLGGATAWISDDFDVDGSITSVGCYCGLDGMQRQPHPSGVSTYGRATQSQSVIEKNKRLVAVDG
jgi:hypothetical protein